MQDKEQTKVVETTDDNETKAHKVKRYLRVLIIFIVFFAGGSLIGSFFSDVLTFDNKQQDLLKKEIAAIGSLTNAEDYDYEKLNKMLDETVTSKEYIPLEKALKSFTKDVIQVTKTVETAMDSDVMEKALTADNIAADGPSFTNTLAELDSLYTTFETAKADFQNLMTEEKVLSYLPEDTDEELVKVYTEIVGGIRMTETDKRYIAMIENIDKRLAMISAEKAAITFLVENQTEWKLEEGYVYFNTEGQVMEYNALLEAFQNAVK